MFCTLYLQKQELPFKASIVIFTSLIGRFDFDQRASIVSQYTKFACFPRISDQIRFITQTYIICIDM